MSTIQPIPATKHCSVWATLISALLVLTACSSSNNSDNPVDNSVDGTSTSVSDTAGSGDTDDTETGDAIDIYNAILIRRSADCADYINTYSATVIDIKNSIDFNAAVLVTATDTECTFTSNSVPNHDFNDETAAFAGGQEGATIMAAATPTTLTQATKNAVFLNGVRLDILSAGCYRPNSPDAGDDGNVGIGCASTDAWLLDPLGTDSKFGVDRHNAHTQPGGLYHYHGGPNALFDDNPGSEGSPVIGFAADGFPVFGSYFYDNETGQVRKAVSGYTLKSGMRGVRSETNPGGAYDGTYNDDWEFTGNGDLDECNGMTVNGQYGYYVTDAYPWVIKCFTGTPHESFGGAGGGPGMNKKYGLPDAIQ